MLADSLMFYCVIFLLIVFAFGGALCVGMVHTAFDVQNEAQAIAMSEGRYGGYTTVAESSVNQYCQQHNLDRSQVNVNVSAPGAPVPYGTNVTAKITIPFRFEIGSFIPGFTVPLTGVGRSVSIYTPGITPDVTYVSP